MSDMTTKDDGSSQSKTVRKEKRAFFFRKWARADVVRASGVLVVHLLTLLAPFYYKWEALRFGLILGLVTYQSVLLSYHRNLSHKSFKLPKWLEYSFSYSALLGLQGHPIDWVSTHRYHHQFTDTDRDPHSPMEGFWFSHLLWAFDTQYTRQKCGGRTNVMDLKKQWFYRFLQNTSSLHILTFWSLIYFWGGLPYLTGVGVGGVISYHGTWIVNSVGHIWGSQAWDTKDTSQNVWWLSLFTMGESWHNNHHAFETSARHGLEWYQIDINWYIILFFKTIGLATDVKLPSDAQKRKMAFVR